MRFTRKGLIKGLVGSFALVFLTSCGLDLDNILNQNGASNTNETENNYELTEFPVSVNTLNLNSDEFGLAALSADVIIQIADSKSGYSGTYNSATHGSTMEAVNGDIFKPKLTQLTYAGNIYKPDFEIAGSEPQTHGTNFTTWDTNDTAIFTTSDGSLKLNVKYLSSCVSSACTAPFTLQFEASGFTLDTNYNSGNNLASSTYSQSVGYTIAGAAAPAFSLKGLAHRGFNSNKGRIKYSFAAECDTNLVYTAPDPGASPPVQEDATCGGVSLNKFRVILLDDAWDGSAPTSAQVDTAVTAATSPSDPPGDEQQLTMVNIPKKVLVNGSLDSIGLTGQTMAKGGFAVDNIETANSGYTKNVKYFCIKYQEGPDKSYNCTKISFDFITQ